MSHHNVIAQTSISAATYRFFDTHGDGNALLEQLVSVIREKGHIPADSDAESLSLFLGTTYSNLQIRNDSFTKYSEKGLRVMNPADAPRGLISYIGGQISIMLNIRGMQSTLSSLHSQGFDAFTQAFYFLKRDSRHKAIVIDCFEEAAGDLLSTMYGCSVVTLEHNAAVPASRPCGSVRAIESCFEAKGGNSGLIKAIKTALDVCRMPISDINYVFLCGLSEPRRRLEQEALHGCGGSEGVTVSLPRPGRLPLSLGLLPLVVFLNEPSYCDTAKKSKCTGMFLNIGEDTNSTCLIVERGGH